MAAARLPTTVNKKELAAEYELHNLHISLVRLAETACSPRLCYLIGVISPVFPNGAFVREHTKSTMGLSQR